MSQPARKLEPTPFPPGPTEAELHAALERARRPDGVVSPELLALELSVEFPDVPVEHPLHGLLNHG